METDLPSEDHHLGLETLFGELTKTHLILEATKGIPGEIHLEATRQEDLPMVSTLPSPGYSMWNPWNGGWIPWNGGWIPWNGGWIPWNGGWIP